MSRRSLASLVFVVIACATSQTSSVKKLGIKEVQVPYSSIKPSATIRVGKTADWVLVTDDAVWVAGAKPYAVLRIDPASNRIVGKVQVSGEVCSGLASGFGSIWTPVCGKKAGLLRIDAIKSSISAVLPIAPAAPEGGIACSEDSVWLVVDKNGTLVRIDPSTNSVRQKVSIPPGSYNPIFSGGIIWISGVDRNLLTAVDARSGKILESVLVGQKPRFLTSGSGSIWTINQGDGTVGSGSV